MAEDYSQDSDDDNDSNSYFDIDDYDSDDYEENVYNCDEISPTKYNIVLWKKSN